MMSPVSGGSGAPSAPPEENLVTMLAEQRKRRAQDEAGASSQLVERVRSGVSGEDLRADIEEALRVVAARATHAVIALGQQRQTGARDPEVVTADVRAAAAALRAAELTVAVLTAAAGSAVPEPRGD